MVWRGSEADLRRYDSAASTRQTNCGDQAADRRGGVHYAVEFSTGDDHPESGTGDCGRMHGGVEASGADAVFRAGAGGTGGTRGAAEGRAEHPDRFADGNWWRADVESRGTEAIVHGVDGSGETADGAMRGDAEEALSGTGRSEERRVGKECR